MQTRRMRSMTFVVHFADDIGAPEQNAEIGTQLADDLEGILLGYLDGVGGINPAGTLLELGSAFGIEVHDADGTTRDVRVREVHYVEPGTRGR